MLSKSRLGFADRFSGSGSAALHCLQAHSGAALRAPRCAQASSGWLSILPPAARVVPPLYFKSLHPLLARNLPVAGSMARCGAPWRISPRPGATLRAASSSSASWLYLRLQLLAAAIRVPVSAAATLHASRHTMAKVGAP